RLGLFDAVVSRGRDALRRCTDPETQQRLRNAVSEALFARGDVKEAHEALGDGGGQRAALEAGVLRARALDELGHLEEALSVCRSLEKQVDDSDPLADRIVEVQVSVLRQRDSFDEARTLLQESIVRHERGGALGLLGDDYTHLGLVEFGQGRMPQARECFERAGQLYERTGNRYGIARALNGLGVAQAETGEHAHALETFRRGLDLCQRLGEQVNATNYLGNLGQLFSVLGRFREALEHVDRGIELAARNGMHYTLTRIRIIRAGILALLGLDAACESALEHALEKVEVDRYEGQVLLIRSDLALRRGRLDEVEGWLDRAERIFDESEIDDELTLTQVARARLLFARGESDEAIALLRATTEVARQQSLPLIESEAEALHAELLLDAGQRDEAERIAAIGLETAERLEFVEATWRQHRVLGCIAAARDDLPAALEHYEACVSVFREVTSELPQEFAGAYLDHPRRRRALEELDALGRRADS
ncbi:MAG: tetratricopeptide repeat protein, partial [Candidatus Krumholzibacteriia bacterium]